ncbi:Rha family transcriptional regulator [Pectobacterium parvum]|nr:MULTISPECIES: Rha family transcriptional regulator [Pectobacterium]UFK41294.1 Rha family transcriptional regulator [Pectobacterium parvum]
MKRLEVDCPPEFNHLNFEEVEYIDKKGEMRRMYSMTKDGFMLVVMGFTGKAAMQSKITYIQAFNWMAGQLQNRQLMGEEAMHQLATEDTRSKLKGTIGS